MNCIHHWLIESPGKGPTLYAVCKLCGAETAFPSGLPDLRIPRQDGLVRRFMDSAFEVQRRSRRGHYHVD